MKRPVEPNWTDLRADYVAGSARSLRAFAEEHGVSYSAVRRHAKLEGWKHLRQVHIARVRVGREERALAFMRQQAALAAEHIIRLCREEQIPSERLCALTDEAAGPVSDLPYAVRRLFSARANLAEAEGREPRRGERELPSHDGTWGRKGSWPMAYDPEEHRHLGPRLRAVRSA